MLSYLNLIFAVLLIHQAHCEQSLESLLEDVSKLTSLMQQQEDDFMRQVGDIENEMLVTERQFQKQHETIQRLVADSQNKVSGVAFSSFISDGQIQKDDGEMIPFDDTFTNIGGHFNVTDYTFTAPADGYYYFSVCLNNGQIGENDRYSRWSESLLMQNRQEVLEIYSYATYESLDDYLIIQACNAVVLECKSNDRVWVESNWDRSRITGVRSRGARSSFVGFYLYPLEE